MRDAKHLKFIRQLPCCVCLRMDTVQAAHIRKGLPAHEKGGMGMKPHDKWTLPMCHFCHAKQHEVGEVSFHFDMPLVIMLASKLYQFSGNKEKCCEEIILYRKELSVMRVRHEKEKGLVNKTI